MTTIAEAYDCMNGVVLAAWQAAGQPVVMLEWPDKPMGQTPDGTAAWARITIKHEDGGQHTMAQKGSRKFCSYGTIFVQVFTPIGGSMVQAAQLVQAIKNAFQDATNIPVWFRRTRVREVGSSGAFQQTNVVSDFSYDELR